VRARQLWVGEGGNECGVRRARLDGVSLGAGGGCAAWVGVVGIAQGTGWRRMDVRLPRQIRANARNVSSKRRKSVTAP
jgi:hypothetical protein